MTYSTPEVTVLTAVKNGEKYLAETIESICAQTHEDWEYIIVDDASTDSTPKIIEKYGEKDKRIRSIHLKESFGPFGAANVGLKQAKGKYIVRSDGDDVSLPGRIETQIKFLKANPNLKACASYAQRIDENSKVLEDRVVKATLTPESLKWFLFLRCPLVHSTACVEKTVFDEMGGYDESFAAQDYRMWAYLSRKNILAQIPEILVYFRLTPGGITDSRKDAQRTGRIQVAQDHIFETIGERWQSDRIDLLHAFGLVKRGFPVKETLAASRLWDSVWMRAEQLPADASEELKVLSTTLRKTFLRRNRRNHPLAVMLKTRDYIFPQPRLGN